MSFHRLVDSCALFADAILCFQHITDSGGGYNAVEV
jgi:hypothetical protein